jgi:hypothetical protein
MAWQRALSLSLWLCSHNSLLLEQGYKGTLFQRVNSQLLKWEWIKIYIVLEPISQETPSTSTPSGLQISDFPLYFSQLTKKDARSHHVECSANAGQRWYLSTQTNFENADALVLVLQHQSTC